MSVIASQSSDQKETTISVSGRFDYSIVQEFRRAYSDKDPTTKFIVNLADTSYLDSSALGMLIHLWKYAGENKDRVAIINSNPAIQKLFTITHLDSRFTIK